MGQHVYQTEASCSVQRVQGYLHQVWASMFTKVKGRPITVLLPVQLKEAAEFREVKLKGKNHILKTGHYRLKNELKSDHKKVEQLQEQVLSGSLPVIFEVHHRFGSLTVDLHPGSFIWCIVVCFVTNQRPVQCQLEMRSGALKSVSASVSSISLLRQPHLI